MTENGRDSIWLEVAPSISLLEAVISEVLGTQPGDLHRLPQAPAHVLTGSMGEPQEDETLM